MVCSLIQQLAKLPLLPAETSLNQCRGRLNHCKSASVVDFFVAGYPWDTHPGRGLRHTEAHCEAEPRLHGQGGGSSQVCCAREEELNSKLHLHSIHIPVYHKESVLVLDQLLGNDRHMGHIRARQLVCPSYIPQGPGPSFPRRSTALALIVWCGSLYMRLLPANGKVVSLLLAIERTLFATGWCPSATCRILVWMRRCSSCLPTT